MKRPYTMIALTLAAMLLLLAGCGGGKQTPSTAGQQTTSASLTITWPERGRLIPLAAESITVAVAGPYGFTAAKTVDRPVTGNTTSVSFPSVPVGELTFTATAYPQTGGQGTAQATATVTQTGQANAPIHVTLTMATTITTIVLTPATPRIPLHGTVQLNVTARNAEKAVVLIDRNDLTWTSSNPAVVTVNNGLITGMAYGAATITASHGTPTPSHGIARAEADVTVMDPLFDPPTPSFTVFPAPAHVNDIIQFDASGSTDAQDVLANLQVRWDWESNGTYDTSYSATKTAQHQYSAAGNYLVRLQVRDSDGNTALIEKPVIVKVKLTVSPSTVALINGQQQTFTAQVLGSTQTGVTWSVLEHNGGTITTNGVYTAPQAFGTFHVIATSKADPTVSAQATVTVNSAPTAAFTVSPATGDVSTIFQFDASGCTDTQDAAADLQVHWDWEGDGTYDTGYTTTKTAQHYYPTAGTYTARLQVKDSGGLTAITERTVTVKVKLTVSPTSATLRYGQQQTFSAQVLGSTQTGVTWSVQESNGGTMTGNVYTAPNASGTFHVIATSVLDPTVSVSVPVTVQGTSGTIIVQ